MIRHEHQPYTCISPRNDIALNVWYFGICDHFPEDPWIHFCNVYIEAYLLFKLKKQCFVKNSSDTSLTGDAFVTYDR
jgi:hypothetical protein